MDEAGDGSNKYHPYPTRSTTPDPSIIVISPRFTAGDHPFIRGGWVDNPHSPMDNCYL